MSEWWTQVRAFKRVQDNYVMAVLIDQQGDALGTCVVDQESLIEPPNGFSGGEASDAFLRVTLVNHGQNHSLIAFPSMSGANGWTAVVRTADLVEILPLQVAAGERTYAKMEERRAEQFEAARGIASRVMNFFRIG